MKKSQLDEVIKKMVKKEILKEGSERDSLIKKCKNFVENETDKVDPLIQIEVFIFLAEYLQRRALAMKKDQG